MNDDLETEGSLADTAPEDAVMGFAELGLRTELLAALTRMGYEEPTPIQGEAIPPILAGRDLVGQAATGTGKTAAFALPILNRLRRDSGSTQPMALVLVPTRELAVQVSEAMYKYGRDLGARVVPIYGGQAIGRQLHQLSAGVHVVVATPGRARDHIARGTLALGQVEIVVLDEADEMLDMGFAEDIEAILDATPASRQTVLFSATMPPRITSIAKRYLKDPLRIEIGKGKSTGSANPLVRQSAYVVQRAHKPAALGRILDVETPVATIVFCRTRDEVDQLTETMNGRGYRAEALHGGMNQEQRDRVMGRLRSGTAELLVATDVAARGLDIDQLSHVVNYDVPSAPESYVHRIGRVGRAGRNGVAITLAEPREQRLLANIERLTKQKISIEKVPTVADLRAKQMESTIATLRAALGGDDLEGYEAVVHALADEFEVEQIALAAIKLVHTAGATSGDERDIPDASYRDNRDRPDRGRPGERNDRGDRGDRGDRPSGLQVKDFRPRQDKRGGDVGGAKLYIGAGRKDGVRPQDLVGAIANETHLSGHEIGPIQIQEHFSVVGVPDTEVDQLIDVLRTAKIKGRKVAVRRFTEHQR